MNLKQYLTERTKLIEEVLLTYLPTLPKVAEQLESAMRYSLFAGGKRIRPILALASAEAVGGDPQAVLPAACALEFIHTYSLIHDDLPAMDDDDWRRGQPTNHKVFGEAQAILAGDALLTHAFAILASPDYPVPIEAEKALRIVWEVADAAGPLGMVGGQSADISQEGTVQEYDAPTVLRYIHTHKTGALLRAAVRTGAIIAEASPEQLAALTLYGENLGLAFQICDDILDATGDPKLLGKPVKTDAQHKKLTYVTVHGLEEAKRAAYILADQAIEALSDFDNAAEPLRALARYTVERQN
ncbi:MAG: polyprenyl synthetase family protein [Firmicutes bacterium]|nr:polyprenyl synthetase family protein [Bacillota bacterium]